MDEAGSGHTPPGAERMPPGAERFWGQFSQARAGRSRAGRQEERSGQGEQHQCLEWCPICRSAELLRGAGGSPELLAQLSGLQEEVARVVRAFADAYSERASENQARQASQPRRHGPAEPEPAASDEVTDIEIA